MKQTSMFKNEVPIPKAPTKSGFLKMKVGVKKSWARALESGKYKQGHSQLYDGVGYCCLGVLTDLYCKKFDVDFTQEYEGGVFLPPEVSEWAGLGKDYDPAITKKPSRGLIEASVLNDVDKYSFKQIAALIRENL